MSVTKRITLTAMFLALVLVFQNIRLVIGQGPHTVYIVGALVNLTLLLTAHYIGITSGIIVSFAAALIALLQGHIPFPQLMPVVALGNSILVVSYALLKKPLKNYAIIPGALLKWAFLYFGVIYVLKTFIRPAVEAPKYEKMFALLSASFNYPQVITAVAGGILLFALIPVMDKAIHSKHSQ